MTNLRFDGSIWCNADIVLRKLNALYEQETQPLGLSIIEWYVLRLLFEHDGQHPHELADGTGRAVTSFTPILDGLVNKELIERRLDPRDRRAVQIWLTNTGSSLKEEVETSAERIEVTLRKGFTAKDWAGFKSVLAYLQLMSPFAE